MSKFINSSVKRKKTLIISAFVPPSVNGPSAILYRLFCLFPKGSYGFLTDILDRPYNINDNNYALDCFYYYFRLPFTQAKNRWLLILVRLLRFLAIPLIVIRAVKIIKREKVDNIWATNDNGPFIISAFLAHKITGRPLYAHMLDLYKEILPSRIEKHVAGLFEEHILKAADRVFVMSEALQEYYQSEYGIKTELLPHPIVLKKMQNEKKSDSANKNIFEIVYTGQMGAAWLDSTLNLVRVVNSLKNVKFSLYIPRPKEFHDYLRQQGIEGEQITISYAPPGEIVHIQQNADLLFLPLTFGNALSNLVIKTASPSKMPEYLVAGVPILVHAPSYSYICKNAREKGWGMVVDSLDYDQLRTAVERLMIDQKLRDQLIQNAQQTIQSHNAQNLSRRLQEYLL